MLFTTDIPHHFRAEPLARHAMMRANTVHVPNYQKNEADGQRSTLNAHIAVAQMASGPIGLIGLF